MAKLDFPNFQKHLSAFDFTKLFTEVLGWNNAPLDVAWQADKAGETNFTRRTVAELGGVVAIQVVVSAQEGSWPDEAQRMRIWKHIARSHAENLIIFTEQQKRPLQSQWYWVKRSKDAATGKPKLTPRRHEYFAGQPVDLFASKLQAMVVELSELDATGRLPVLEAARRIQAALDVDKTTKKTGSDINLYKLFVERSFHLLRPGGHCGIVIPSGLYTDLGTKGLRDLLFTQTQIEGLFCFENRKEIFEGVHRSFKFVVLTFEKSATSPSVPTSVRAEPVEARYDTTNPSTSSGQTENSGGTTRFPAAFMRHDVAELVRFPEEGAIGWMWN